LLSLATKLNLSEELNLSEHLCKNAAQSKEQNEQTNLLNHAEQQVPICTLNDS